MKVLGFQRIQKYCHTIALNAIVHIGIESELDLYIKYQTGGVSLGDHIDELNETQERIREAKKKPKQKKKH